MNAKKTWWLGLALAMAGLTQKAQAAATTTAYLNIDVTITAQLSVKVDNVASSTYGITWNGTPNQQFASDTLSSATVTNDTGILSERWLLATNANSINVPGNAANWAVSASSTAIGADKFALQAVFGSSRTAAGGCLIPGAGTWNDNVAAPLISATQQMYTSTRFVGSTLTQDGASPAPDLAGGTMYGNGKRALCWRLIMPDSTSTQDTQNVQILVTATP